MPSEYAMQLEQELHHREYAEKLRTRIAHYRKALRRLRDYPTKECSCDFWVEDCDCKNAMAEIAKEALR